MARSPDHAGPRFDADLVSHSRKSLLRVMTCGSVDDGKSTLIGRLLYESNGLFDDQLTALAADSHTSGTRGTELDFALVTDGLSAEREQGITIDVAYRYFSTATRKFIIADTPGHEQYTRNMVTGASTADLAIVLIDARKGVLTQTRRHLYVVSLLGIKQVVVAINKMDLVEYSERIYNDIQHACQEFAARIGIPDVTCIPLSAVHGDNIVTRSPATAWYRGPTLLEHLEAAPDVEDAATAPLRLLVQRIIRPDDTFRGAAGFIASGAVHVGDGVAILPSGASGTIARVLIGDADVGAASAGQSVTVTFSQDVDVTRGDVLASPQRPPQVADQFQAAVVWMHDEPMLPGRSYLLKLGTQTAIATVAPLKYAINVNTLEHVSAHQLNLNDIGVCELELNRPVVFEPYQDNRDLGGFILIDRVSSDTVGAGLLHFALWRSTNVRWQAFDVDRRARAELKQQKPCVLWFTGLPAAGKSTIANLVEKRLHALGHHTYLLDGDNVRHGLNKDLGFTAADRVENIRRVAEVARLMADAGLIVIVSFISPFRSERRMARELMAPGEFLEIFIDTPLPVAEARDPKGLYKKARRGEVKNFTGVDSPYEVPENPELRIDTTTVTAEQAAAAILQRLVSALIVSKA